MLNLLRRYVKPRGRAVYSIFLDRLSTSGHGFMDAWARKMGEQAVGKTETYRDFTRDDPLKQALYSEEYARVSWRAPAGEWTGSSSRPSTSSTSSWSYLCLDRMGEIMKRSETT